MRYLYNDVGFCWCSFWKLGTKPMFTEWQIWITWVLTLNGEEIMLMVGWKQPIEDRALEDRHKKIEY